MEHEIGFQFFDKDAAKIEYLNKASICYSQSFSEALRDLLWATLFYRLLAELRLLVDEQEIA